MDYTLVRYLLAYVEEFHQEHASHEIEAFIVWLNNKLFSASQADDHAPHDELMIAFKVMYLNKDLKKKTKQVLLSANVSSIDEYSFLLHLCFQESFRKMEIIQMHNLEAPTGIDVIKRLLKKGLIEEFPDQEDRRSKRIKITPKGAAEVKVLQPQINSIFQKFVEPLSLNERVQVSGLLNKLIG